jgi:trigger factor
VKVSVEKLPTSEAVLDVELSWDELEKASDKAYRRLVQKVDVQGFRRGKAPRSLLERKLGKEYIYQEGLDDLITEVYRSTIKEHDLTPITKPELDAPVFEAGQIGQPYHFSLKVPILTPVVLGDYRSLHFDREEVNITSEEVEQEIETLRNRQAQWRAVDRPAAIGDRVTMDLKLSAGEQSISDLKNNPFELTGERHGIYAGMDEHIVGMQVGASKTFTTTLPEDYSNEKLAGKEAQYDVTLHKVEARELPELDDAFAEQAGYETPEDLRKATSDRILESKKRRVNNELRDRVVQAVIDQAQVTIHPVLVSEEAEDMLHQFSHMLEQQRMSMDQYLLMMRKSREEYLKDIQPDAEERVKRQLVLDEVARQEEISITPEELEALLRAYTQAGYNIPRSEEQLQSIAISYRREKAITRLVELTTDPDPDLEAEGTAGDEAASDEAQTSSEAVEADAGETGGAGKVGEIGEAFSSGTESE